MLMAAKKPQPYASVTNGHPLRLTITASDCLLTRRCPAQACPRCHCFRPIAVCDGSGYVIHRRVYAPSRVSTRGQLVAPCPCQKL